MSKQFVEELEKLHPVDDEDVVALYAKTREIHPMSFAFFAKTASKTDTGFCAYLEDTGYTAEKVIGIPEEVYLKNELFKATGFMNIVLAGYKALCAARGVPAYRFAISMAETLKEFEKDFPNEKDKNRFKPLCWAGRIIKDGTAFREATKA